MDASTTKQVFDTIGRAKQPLIVVSKDAGIDGVAAALGLENVLSGLGIQAKILAPDDAHKNESAFLPKSEIIQDKLSNIRKLEIEIDVGKTKPHELSYNVADGKLKINLIPKEGVWQREDIRAKFSAYKHDLIVCLGTTNLNALGQTFLNHTDFFHQTALINIDHAPDNEHFGNLNMVDITSAAICEVIYKIIVQEHPALLNAEAATCFLTGIISKTHGFKKGNITPKTLSAFSHLIELGAKREHIIEKLYRNHNLETLKLWGRALTKLKSHPEAALVWTVLSRQDFIEAGAEENDLPDVIDEMIASAQKAKVIILLYEDNENNVCGIVRAEHPFDALALTAPFSPSGGREISRICFVGKNIVQVEKELVEKIKIQILKHGSAQ